MSTDLCSKYYESGYELGCFSHASQQPVNEKELKKMMMIVIIICGMLSYYLKCTCFVEMYL